MRIQRGSLPSSEAQLRGLKREFKVQSRRGNDLRKRLLFGELHSLFETEGIDEVFWPVLQARSTLGTRDAAQLGMRALQKQGLYRLPGLQYPAQEISKTPWNHLITTVMRDPALRAEFSYDITNRDVSSNLGERYKSLKLLIPLLSQRFERDVRILDIGCSQNQGLKQLHASRVIPYEPIRAGRPRRWRTPGSYGGESIVDNRLGRRLNTMLAAGDLAIGRCLGIDKEPKDRSDVIEWTKACSFYPSELLMASKVEKYDIIEASTPNPADVDFCQLNILGIDRREAVDRMLAQHGTFDIVMFSTMKYQLSDQQREIADAIATRCVDPNRGLVITQDFAEINVNDPTRLSFFDDWDPYTYQTVARDMMNPETLQQLFVWDSGRCEKLQLGAGRLCVGQNLLPVSGILAA